MRFVARIAAVALPLALGACGSDPGVTEVASVDLLARVDRVEAAVDEGDAEAAHERLIALEKAVSRWLDDGQLSEARAAEILSASTAVAARIDAIEDANPSPTPTVTVVVTATETAVSTATATATETVILEHPGKGKDKDEDDGDE